MKKKRTYNLSRIRQNHSYSLPEIADLFGVHKNTIGQWMKQGLPRIDDTRPYLIHGSDLKAFLSNRQKSRKQKCDFNEFYCFRCRRPRAVWENLVDIVYQTAHRLIVTGVCAICGLKMNKAVSVKLAFNIHKTFTVQQVQNSHLVETTELGVKCDFKAGELR